MVDHAPPPPENHGPAMLGVQWGLFSGATVMVLLRFYVRVIMKKTFGWDDFWMALAWLTALYMSVVMLFNIQAGFGQHAYYVHQNAKDILFYNLLAEMGVAWGITFVKLSITAFILRLVAKIPKLKYVRWLCWLNIAMFVPITIAVFLVICLQCRPLTAYWRELMPRDKCLSPSVIIHVVIVYSAAGAASDLLTGIIPIFIIKDLQLNKSRKIGLSIITGLVCMVSAVAILKAVVSPAAYSGDDQTFDVVPVAIYSAVEHEAGIIIACLPTLPALFSGAWHGLMTTMSQLRHRESKQASIGSDMTLTNRDGSAKSSQVKEIVRTVEVNVEHGCVDDEPVRQSDRWFGQHHR